jgi:hypothetical protein
MLRHLHQLNRYLLTHLYISLYLPPEPSKYFIIYIALLNLGQFLLRLDPSHDFSPKTLASLLILTLNALIILQHFNGIIGLSALLFKFNLQSLDLLVLLLQQRQLLLVGVEVL